MLRSILTFIVLAISTTVFSQGFNYHSDFKKILQQSQNSMSDYYYPKLLHRFNSNDSSLTNRDMLALQIGFTADAHYKPYETISDERAIMNLVQEQRYQEALAACNELLKTNPVNLTALMEKSFAYMKLDKDSMQFHKEKIMKILRAVMASGNGSRENPYFVLSPIDGQTLITHLWGASIGLMGSGKDPNGYFLDMLEMKQEDKQPRTLYFNINHATDRMFTEDDLKKVKLKFKEQNKRDKKH